MTENHAKPARSTAEVEDHLIEIGFRDPDKARPRAPADLVVPPIDPRAFVFALLATPAAIGLPAMTLGAITGSDLLNFIAGGVLFALPPYLLAGAPFFRAALTRRWAPGFPVGACAAGGLLANLLTVPVYALMGIGIWLWQTVTTGDGGDEIRGAVFVGSFAMLFGFAFAPAMGAVFGALYGWLRR
ncbi:MAG: hypothetical protein ACFBSD_11470 [Paracoccaceae bacterium]